MKKVFHLVNPALADVTMLLRETMVHCIAKNSFKSCLAPKLSVASDLYNQTVNDGVAHSKI